MLTIISFSIKKNFKAEHASLLLRIKAYLRGEKINLKWHANGQILIQGEPDVKQDDTITVMGSGDFKVLSIQRGINFNGNTTETLVDVVALTPLYEYEIERLNQRSMEHGYVSEVGHYL